MQCDLQVGRPQLGGIDGRRRSMGRKSHAQTLRNGGGPAKRNDDVALSMHTQSHTQLDARRTCARRPSHFPVPGAAAAAWLQVAPQANGTKHASVQLEPASLSSHRALDIHHPTRGGHYFPIFY
ncbi:hypothetical protein ACCO45_003535 [Purpureocillium lilacinum]|uniref:Uncharacterized protein n=1 Tax=Purpureocillium lilacinum TaxID=33203 RepID=A0ACC4E1H0_PURLI